MPAEKSLPKLSLFPGGLCWRLKSELATQETHAPIFGAQIYLDLIPMQINPDFFP